MDSVKKAPGQTGVSSRRASREGLYRRRLTSVAILTVAQSASGGWTMEGTRSPPSVRSRNPTEQAGGERSSTHSQQNKHQW